MLENTVFVDQEGTAFNSYKLFVALSLEANDIEQFTQLAPGVGNQLKRKFLLFPELVVGGHCVLGYAEYLCISFQKQGVVFRERLPFTDAARCVVFRIKVENEVGTFEGVQ